jgi:hypothetical protein
VNSRSRRLDEPFRGLTVMERAGLLLRYVRRGATPDKAILATMPAEEREEFDYRIDLMCAVNEDTPYILLLREQVATLDVTFELLRTRQRLGEDTRVLGSYIRESVGEPVTASEYRSIEEEHRAQLVPIHHLVEIAVEHYAGWTDADYREDAGERVLTDEACARAFGDTEHELIELFNDGTLAGEQDETGVHVRAGTFYDWLGEPMPILSETGCWYRVLPDGQAEEVVSERHARNLVDELVKNAPGRCDLPLEPESSLPDPQSRETGYTSIARMDVIKLRDGIQRGWRGLRCYEIVMAALAANEFNNEDALDPQTRKVLRAAKRHLIALAEKLEPYAGEVELLEPKPEALEQLRSTILRSAERHRLPPV